MREGKSKLPDRQRDCDAPLLELPHDALTLLKTAAWSASSARPRILRIEASKSCPFLSASPEN
jgi:hypothetical protein